jgi:hypothetical protein
MMKSNKQRRQEIKAARLRRAAKAERQRLQPSPQAIPVRFRVPVDATRLAPCNSYGHPLALGWYEDRPFRCRDCGAEQLWTAEQQKWWYETLRGSVYAIAVRCRPCRQALRAQKMNGAGH